MLGKFAKSFVRSILSLMPRDSFVHLHLRTKYNVENYEPDSYCEPDDEDFAYMIAQEREVASLRSEYHDAHRQLCNYQKYTDRQLRALSKEKKGCERDLAQAHQFDVVSDSFDVETADDVWDTVPWPYEEGEDVSDRASRVLTRKDKRRAKTKQRKAAKYLRIRRTQWEKSRAASLVRKTRALVPTVAA
jgi:hypothetical protein